MSAVVGVIELEVLGYATPIQVASALIDYTQRAESGKDTQLIAIEEIADHLYAYCKAEKERFKRL